MVEIDPDGQNWCRCFKEKNINSLFLFKPAKINDDTSFKFHIQYFEETIYNRFIVEWILFNSFHHEKGTAKKIIWCKAVLYTKIYQTVKNEENR